MSEPIAEKDAPACDCESMGGRFGSHRPECPWQIAFEAQLAAEKDAGLDKRQKRRARRRAALTPDVIEQAFTRGRKYVTRAWKRAQDAARKRADRLIQQRCSEGNCVEFIDPDTGENTGGWGPVGCPCQDTDTRVTSPAKSLRQIASEHGITPVGTDIDIETGKRVLPPAGGRVS